MTSAATRQSVRPTLMPTQPAVALCARPRAHGSGAEKHAGSASVQWCVTGTRLQFNFRGAAALPPTIAAETGRSCERAVALDAANPLCGSWFEAIALSLVGLGGRRARLQPVGGLTQLLVWPTTVPVDAVMVAVGFAAATGVFFEFSNPRARRRSSSRIESLRLRCRTASPAGAYASTAM